MSWCVMIMHNDDMITFLIIFFNIGDVTISEVLNEPKTRYPQVRKLLYAILMTSHKLRHYFEYYKIVVVTKFPLGDILRNKEANGASSSGLLSSPLTPLNSEAGLPSSHRRSLTSLLSGPRSKSPSPLLAPSTGWCTSTAPSTSTVLDQRQAPIRSPNSFSSLQ